MFENLALAPIDPIFELMAIFAEDKRHGKIDLGIGVYKDENNNVPIMAAVKQAEQRLVTNQKTKAYIGSAGSFEFADLVKDLVFAGSAKGKHIMGLQTPGGTAALRILIDVIAQDAGDATAWVSDPSWPIHVPLFARAGFASKSYAYFDSARNVLVFEDMLASLAEAKRGDIIVLHGCCHNPTGTQFSPDQWQVLADLCAHKGLFPFIDLAYQGFGQGLDDDAAGVRIMAQTVPELAVAASCSKNFSIYRERAGAAFILAKTQDAAKATYSQLNASVRSNYSMPPDHGAAIVTMILTDEKLRTLWETELSEIRARMMGLRRDFAAALRQQTQSDQFDFIEDQVGMFSRLPLSIDQILTLRDRDGIYMLNDGRVNVAGLPADRLEEIAKAIARVL